MRILVVGSNPTAGIAPGARPFEGMRGGKRLQAWLEFLGAQHTYELVNASDRALKTGESLKSADVRPEPLLAKSLEADVIIALGTNSNKALNKLGVKHLRLPHPSRMNRNLNDRRLLEVALNTAADYIKHKEVGLM